MQRLILQLELKKQPKKIEVVKTKLNAKQQKLEKPVKADNDKDIEKDLEYLMNYQIA